jgi:glucose/arabinose dehydrogenase
LAVNDNGDVYVKLSIENGDGIADIIKRFGNYPNDGRFATEMRIQKGYLYYSSELVVYRQKLIDGQLIPEGEPEVIMIDQFPIRWHNSKSLAFDNSGGMYVTFSAPTNVCEDQSIIYTDATSVVKGEYPCSQLDILGGIWKFDEATPNQKQGDGELFAKGLRSIVALSLNTQDNQL